MLNRSASLALSKSVLEALSGKLDIKRHTPVGWINKNHRLYLRSRDHYFESNRSHFIVSLSLTLYYLLSTGLEIIQLFPCSTQLSMKFQILKCRQMKKFLVLSISDVVFITLIIVNMPTIVGILAFKSRVNFVLS